MRGKGIRIQVSPAARYKAYRLDLPISYRVRSFRRIYGKFKIKKKANKKTSTLNIRTDYNRPHPIFITIDITGRASDEENAEPGIHTEKNESARERRNTYSVIMAMRISEYLPTRGNAHKFYSLLRIDSKLKVIECKKFGVMWMRNVFRQVRCKWILWYQILRHSCTHVNAHIHSHTSPHMHKYAHSRSPTMCFFARAVERTGPRERERSREWIKAIS